MTPAPHLERTLQRLRAELATSLTMADRLLAADRRTLFSPLLASLGTLQTAVRSCKWMLRRYTQGEGTP
jgi:hypothetical protein